MSTRTRATTNMTDQKTIEKILDELGFTFRSDAAGNLRTSRRYGAGGDRVHIQLTGLKGKSTNQDLSCIGLKKTEDGTYEAVGDFWHLRDANGKPLHNANGLKKLMVRRYGYHKALSTLAKKGFRAVENKNGEVNTENKIKVKCTRMPGMSFTL